MSWRELEAGDAEIAQTGRERLELPGIAFLGTLRRDGWPRVSPVEVHVAGGELLIGLMPRSLKLRDLERDPRCTLQSAIAGPNSGEPEVKLYCRAVGVDDDGVRNGAEHAWWVGRPRSEARVFALDVEEAALVSWDLARGEMTVRSWSPRRGSQVRRVPYP